MVMDGLFDSFGKETTVYRTKITFETMTMLANLTTKLTDFFIDTWTPVIIIVTE